MLYGVKHSQSAGHPSGPATKVPLRRAFVLFGDDRYARLAQISVSHLYDLSYEKLLEPDTTPTALERQASAMSDDATAERVQLARKKLFQSFTRRSRSAA